MLQQVRSRRAAFTLRELLVLLALTLVVFGLAFPAMAGIREASGRATSQNNLKQLTLGTISCADTNSSKLPPAFEGWFPGTNSGGYGSCLFHVLPYLEQYPVYDSSHVQSPTGVLYANWKCEGFQVKVFTASDDPTWSSDSKRSSYVANSLCLPRQRLNRFPSSIADGCSQTIFFAEGYSQAMDSLASAGKSLTWKTERFWWSNPVWVPAHSAAPCQFGPSKDTASANLPQGFTSAGINVGLGDGSVHFVSSAVRAETFYVACTPASDDVLGFDW